MNGAFKPHELITLVAESLTCVRNLNAPKAQNMKAQGNALGENEKQTKP